ncbi:MAG TPA: PilT/PilU family type 4a pilus ATPase [Terriglobales bacterium]|nr:PilT/PilU family type 4a pilus ATPase [Terriglobales bacterium]
MASPGTAPISLKLEANFGAGGIATDTLLSAMLRASSEISEIIFSPGRAPQVEIHGQLIPIQSSRLPMMTADETRRVASDLIGNNKQAVTMLREQGYCDVSYGISGIARFRANIFIQRGSCAVVMRVIPSAIPDIASLNLPAHLGKIGSLREGIVLVTGPRASGKSSTLAALLDRINEQQTCHIITIEDPIEFLHNHKRATVHQRELHSDTPSFILALRAALRQAPRVILVSEIRDQETLELILEAAESGHLVLSSLSTVDAVKTVERFVNMFESSEQQATRARLAKTLRYVISQRLIPRKDGNGRVAAIEVLHVDTEVRSCMEQENQPSASLSREMKRSTGNGTQHFDAAISQLVRSGVVDVETALAHASEPGELRQALGETDY